MQKLASLIVILVTTIFMSAQAQTKEEKQVAAAVETLKLAMIDGNKSALENIIFDGVSYGHSNGKLQDKATFIDALANGQSDFVTISLTDQTIIIKGQTAIVRHKLSAETNDGGKPGTVNINVMLVWVKEKGAWKLFGRQAYKL